MRLLAQQDGDLPRFYAAVRELSRNRGATRRAGAQGAEAQVCAVTGSG